MKKSRVEELRERLVNYPGPHPNEKWKLETDLTKCTVREMRELQRLGVTVGQLMAAGFNRGEGSPHPVWIPVLRRCEDW